MNVRPENAHRDDSVMAATELINFYIEAKDEDHQASALGQAVNFLDDLCKDPAFCPDMVENITEFLIKATKQFEALPDPTSPAGWKLFLVLRALVMKDTPSVVSATSSAGLPLTVSRLLDLLHKTAPDDAKEAHIFTLLSSMCKHLDAAELVLNTGVFARLLQLVVYPELSTPSIRTGVLSVLRVLKTCFPIALVSFVQSAQSIPLLLSALKPEHQPTLDFAELVFKMIRQLLSVSMVTELNGTKGGLLEDFRKAQGYTLLADFLKWHLNHHETKREEEGDEADEGDIDNEEEDVVVVMHTEPKLETINTVKNFLKGFCKLVYIGKEDIRPSAEQLTRAQIPEKLRRATPPVSARFRDEPIRSLRAFECLLDLFTSLQPPVYRLQCLQYAFDVVRSNAMNYLVVRETFIPSLVEQVRACPLDVKRQIFKVVRFGLMSTDFVPYQEACLVVNFLKRPDLDSETEMCALECLSQVLTEDLVEQQRLLVEAGLLTHLYGLIRGYHSGKLKTNSTRDRVREAEDRHPPIVVAWFDCFFWLVKNNLSCIDVAQVRGWLLDYFKYGNNEFRPQALRLMEDFVLSGLRARSEDRARSVSTYINTLLSFLKDLPSHDINSQCLILRSLRTLMQEDKSPKDSAKDIFVKRSGLRAVVSLLERLSDPSELQARLDRQRSKISPTPSAATTSRDASDRLQFVRHVMLTLTAALSGKPEHRKIWQRTIGFERLAFIVRGLGIETHPQGPSCVVSWFLWIAIEYIPTSELHQDPLSPVHRPNALTVINSFSPSPSSDSNGVYPVLVPEAAHVSNPSAVLPAFSLLVLCEVSFQVQIIGYIHRLCKNEVHNRAMLAEEGLMSTIVHTYWSLFQDESLALSSVQHFSLLESLTDRRQPLSLASTPTDTPKVLSRRVSIVTPSRPSSSLSPQSSPKARNQRIAMTPPRVVIESKSPSLTSNGFITSLLAIGSATPPIASSSSASLTENLSVSTSPSASSSSSTTDPSAPLSPSCAGAPCSPAACLSPLDTMRGELTILLLQLIQLLVVFTPKFSVSLDPLFCLLESSNVNILHALTWIIKQAQHNGKMWPYVSFDGVAMASGAEPSHVVINTVKTQPAKGIFPTDGYTLMFWVYVANFGGPETSIRIFTLKSDEGPRKPAIPVLKLFFRQQCLHAVGQTGSASAFKYQFEIDRWYHVTLTHLRGKIMYKSAMTLFVNGRQDDILHVSYPPATTGVMKGVIGYEGAAAEGLQEFDEDAVAEVEDHTIQWRMAGCLMTEGCLSPSCIRVCYEAKDSNGPRPGTDPASEALAIRSYPGLSQMAKCMGHHKWVPESPNRSHLAYPKRFQITLPSDIPPEHILFFFHAAAAEGPQRLVNQSRALSVFAELKGDAKLYVPHGLPELVHVVGGLVRVFALIARAATKRQLRLSLLFLASLLQDNAMNHKEMERVKGFPILNHILKHRIHLVDRHVINMLFGFCGLSDGCTSGEIVNLAAFQAFFLDWGLWHSCDPRCKVYVFQCWYACLTANPNSANNLATMRSLEILHWLCAFLGNVKLVDDLIHVGDHVRMLIGVFLSNNFTRDELKVVADWIVSPLSSICYVVPLSVPRLRKVVAARRRFSSPFSDPTEEASSEDDSEVIGTRTVCTRVLLLEVICSLLQRQPGDGLRAHVAEVLTLDWAFGVLFRAKHLWSQDMEEQESVAAVCVLKLLSTLFAWRTESRREFSQTGHHLLSRLLADAQACNEIEVYRVLLSSLVGINPDEVNSKPDSVLSWFERDRDYSVKVPELLGVIFSVLETRLICQHEIELSSEKDSIVEDLIEVLILLCDRCVDMKATMWTPQNLQALINVFFWRSKLQYDQDNISTNEHSNITPDIDIFNHAEFLQSPTQVGIEERKIAEPASFRDPSSEAIFRLLTKLALDSLYFPNQNSVNTLNEILDCPPLYASAHQCTEFQTKMFQELGFAILADAQFASNLVATPSLMNNFRQVCEHWLIWSNLNSGEGLKTLLEVLASLLSSPFLSQDSSSSILRWTNSNKAVKEELTKTLHNTLLLAYAYSHGGRVAEEKKWGPRTQAKSWRHDLIWLHSLVSRFSTDVFENKNSDLIGCFLFHLFYDFMEELSGTSDEREEGDDSVGHMSEEKKKEDSELALLRDCAFVLLKEIWTPELMNRLVLNRNKYKSDDESKKLFERAFDEGYETLQKPTSLEFRVWISQKSKPLSKAFLRTLVADWKGHWARLQEQTKVMATNAQRVARIRQAKSDLQEQFKLVAAGKQRLLRQMHGVHSQTLLYLRHWVQSSENWQRDAEVLWWRMVEQLQKFEATVTQKEHKILEEKSLIGVDSKDDSGFEPLPIDAWHGHERPRWGLEEKHFWKPGTKIGISIKAEDFSEKWGHGIGTGSGEGTGNGNGEGGGSGSGLGEGNGNGGGSGNGNGEGTGNGDGTGEGQGDGSSSSDTGKPSILDEIQRKLEEAAEQKKLEESQLEVDGMDMDAPPPPPPPDAPPEAPAFGFDMPAAKEEPTGPQLRRFHWEKMQGVDLSKTVWGSLGEIQIDLDMDRFEESFTAAPAVKKVEEKPTTTLVKFTNARRSQVVEIGLARFNMSITEIHDAIVSIDPRLDAFKLKRLVQFLPTNQEIEQINGYNGDPALLGGTEKFFKEMACIPHVAARVRALCFCCTFHSTYEDILFRLAIVESCREKIEKSTSLRQVLAVVLQLGNRMNQATSKGQAAGFRLASLARLRQTKTADNKSSLLHYLVEHVQNKIPRGCDFLVELEGLKEGARIETAQLQSEVSALSEGLDDFKVSIGLVGNSDPPSALFHKHCSGICRTATKELAVLTSQLSSCVDKCNDLALFFGEASLMGWEELFNIFNEFCAAFKQAQDDIEKQKELVAAARKRQELADTLQRAKKSASQPKPPDPIHLEQSQDDIEKQKELTAAQEVVENLQRSRSKKVVAKPPHPS